MNALLDPPAAVLAVPPLRRRREHAAKRNAGQTRLRSLVRHQAAIAELGRRAAEGLESDRLLAECAALVARTLEIEACAMLESLPKDGQFIVRASSGLSEAQTRLSIPDTTQSFAGQVLRQRAPLVVENYRENGYGVGEEGFDLPIRSSLGVAVGGRRDGEPFGVLQAYSLRWRRFTRDEVLFVQFIANTAAAAIERDRQERALRLGEARYQRIAAHTPGMVYQFRLRPDGSFSFPFVTEGCREMFMVEPQEIYDNPLIVIGILHEEDRGSLFPAIMASAQTMTPFHWIGRYVTCVGETRWMRADARPERLEDGDVLWDGIMFDISTLKATQAALSDAKTEAERANRAKSDFLSRISHELRTPLNAILGFSQFLQRQAASEMQGECLSHITRAGSHLLGLINEVLDISRIEAGHVELTLVPVCVGQTVQEALALIRPQARERCITLRLTRPAQAARQHVLADPQRLKQVLLNLLSNAVKYNVNGGRVTVSCHPVPGGELEIAVTDTGLGIPAEKLPRLFVAFDRLGAEQSSVPGTGLGLVLSKYLVQALGGSLAVESTPGRGSTFRVRLPAADEPASSRTTRRRAPVRRLRTPPAAVPPPAPVVVEPHRVLYIEDNYSNLCLIEHFLADQPQLTLLKATRAAEGLEIIRQSPPDLLLLDLHLPDLSGEEILDRLRRDDATRALPVVILSADATAASIERLTALGANAYLTKPLDLPTLLATLHKHLGRLASGPRQRVIPACHPVQ